MLRWAHAQKECRALYDETYILTYETKLDVRSGLELHFSTVIVPSFD